MNACRLFRWIAVLVFLIPAVARAQGLLVVVGPTEHVRLPRPIIIWPHPMPQPEPVAMYKIDELEVDARLVDQVARVQVSQSFVNTGSRQLEVSFIFPLPYDGAIDRMTLLVDGKEMPAKLMDAAQARRIYEDIVRKNRDPALLEWIGTGMFQTSVFPVPPGARRTVSLRYSQLCRKQEGMTDFLFPLSTAKYTSHPVSKVNFRVAIESQDEIKNVYSPTHAVEIKRPDDRHAVVTYTAKDQVPNADFRLFYDVGRGKVGMRVLSYRPNASEDGYFLLLASPEIKPSGAERPKKTVELVIDRSGSMSGKKIEQVRAALKHVLDNLREGDLFNVIAYDSEIESFRPELQRYDEKTRREALGFVDGIYAGGSTNINQALHVAFGQLQDSSRPNYIVFLTDGIPTVGETNDMKIIAATKGDNKVHARLFAFGVGYDVNARLLDKLVRENFGLSEFVRPDENIEEHVARLFNRIESPVMTGLQIRFDFDNVRVEEGNPINRVYPRGSMDLFAGEQLVMAGRYRKPGLAKVVIAGAVGSRQEKFDFAATLVEHSSDESLAFVEKLWAIRRVGEILDELDLKGKNEELVKELVELATRHGVLTPYTSFMADEGTNLHDFAGNAATARHRLESFSITDGAAGVAQRAMKGQFQQLRQADAKAANLAFDRDFSRGGGGMGGAMPSAPMAGRRAGEAGNGYRSEAAKPDPAAAAGLGYGDSVVREAESAEQSLRNVGNRSFYRREGQWIDSQVTKLQQQNAKRVKQFSDEYFALSRTHGRTLSQYLVFDEPVVLNLGDQTYLIEP